MPRDAQGRYSKPVGTEAVPSTTIRSDQFNDTVNDFVADANNPRPVTSGGTGGVSAQTARQNLGAVAKSGDTIDGDMIHRGFVRVSGSRTGNDAIVDAERIDAADLEVGNENGGAALVFFERSGSFGAYLGIDKDNQWKVGGWTMGPNAYKLWHEGSDGPGSGLNADLLDDLQGSAYGRLASPGLWIARQTFESDTDFAVVAKGDGGGWGRVVLIEGGGTEFPANLSFNVPDVRAGNIGMTADGVFAINYDGWAGNYGTDTHKFNPDGTIWTEAYGLLHDSLAPRGRVQHDSSTTEFGSIFVSGTGTYDLAPPYVLTGLRSAGNTQTFLRGVLLRNI